MAKKHVLFVDSSFFFPAISSDGYSDEGQAGRRTLTASRLLQAPLLLPVGAKMISITIYYKNTTADQMQVAILKKHIDHHAHTGEVEVSLDFCPPASFPPDNFVSKVITHFDAAGVIKDKYLYFIQVLNTTKADDTKHRFLRGIRIEYQY